MLKTGQAKQGVFAARGLLNCPDCVPRVTHRYGISRTAVCVFTVTRSASEKGTLLGFFLCVCVFGRARVWCVGLWGEEACRPGPSVVEGNIGRVLFQKNFYSNRHINFLDTYMER